MGRNTLPHRKDFSRETNLRWDRSDSQLTDSVRTPGADVTFFRLLCLCAHRPTEKRETEREERRETGLTRHDKAATALCWAEAVIAPRRHAQTPSVQMVEVDRARPASRR